MGFLFSVAVFPLLEFGTRLVGESRKNCWSWSSPYGSYAIHAKPIRLRRRWQHCSYVHKSKAAGVVLLELEYSDKLTGEAFTSIAFI
jgi:hypothetical protein